MQSVSLPLHARCNSIRNQCKLLARSVSLPLHARCNMPAKEREVSCWYCQLTPTREVQLWVVRWSIGTLPCQLTPTREVQRQSCVPLRGRHVYQLHFLHAKACRLYGLFSTGLSFLQNCRKPCREFPYSTSCVGLRALPRLTALQSAENSGAKVLWFL